MIEPKVKALELVDEIYYDIDYDSVGAPSTKRMVAKQCALKAVDEILKSHEMSVFCEDIVLDYWKEVKKEIEKI